LKPKTRKQSINKIGEKNRYISSKFYFGVQKGTNYQKLQIENSFLDAGKCGIFITKQETLKTKTRKQSFNKVSVHNLNNQICNANNIWNALSQI